MAGRVLAFVQFPHPGGEHSVAQASVWNPSCRAHARKFLIAPGEYAERGSKVRADLVFWGEWEPPSEVVHKWKPDAGKPRSLQRPYWGQPPGGSKLQNTDPWIWGEQMAYSNCKQTTGADDSPTAMQNLAPGSVICFGSTIKGDFCVDTVFVVASHRAWSPAASEEALGDAFQTCTANALVSNPGPHLQTTLYLGATHDNPVNGMYSFVPAQRDDSPCRRFERPSIHLEGLVNPASRQSYRGPNESRSISEVQSAWQCVFDQVTREHLAAVRLDTPHSRGELSITTVAEHK